MSFLEVQGDPKNLYAPGYYGTESYVAQSVCLAADRQGQGDTRLTLTPSVIHNSNYVIMVTDWNRWKYFCLFL
jgi:6-phosphogluconolactonase/glucosamine-6-phosphate isomerase/deaminase